MVPLLLRNRRQLPFSSANSPVHTGTGLKWTCGQSASSCTSSSAASRPLPCPTRTRCAKMGAMGVVNHKIICLIHIVVAGVSSHHCRKRCLPRSARATTPSRFRTGKVRFCQYSIFYLKNRLGVSFHAKDMIAKLIVVDRNQRYTARQVRMQSGI